MLVPRGVRLKGFTVSFKAPALTAQSNQNIRMKMGVADIRLVDSIVVNIVDESLKLIGN